MGCSLMASTPLTWTSISLSGNLKQLGAHPSSTVRFRCSSSESDVSLISEEVERNGSMTGGSYDFERATTSLTRKTLSAPKKVTLVRHGLSSWNEESRVQGSSDLSVLTETGVRQAEKCMKALADIYFDQCFSSPISRAKSTAEILWKGRDQPLAFLDSLKEAHLFYLEGMKNVTFRVWRQRKLG